MAKRDVLKSFGARVREFRLKKELSQLDLARLAKLDPSYVGGIERGERNAGIRNVHRLADALGVSAADLFRDGAENG